MPSRTPVSDLGNGLGHVLTVTGHEPLPELTSLLEEACRAVEDAERSVLVVRTSSPGLDVAREWPGDVTVADVNRWERAVRRTTMVPAMTIAAAEGTCAGASLDLLLATDFRVTDHSMRLLLPVNDGHVWPGMAIHRMVTQLGLATARRLVLWGEEVAADQAERIGLVDRVVDDVPAATHEAVLMMGRISDRELAIRRQLLVEAATTPADEGLGAHLAACDRELRRLQGHAS